MIRNYFIRRTTRGLTTLARSTHQMWIRRLTFNALLCLLKRNSGTKLLQLPPRALPLSFLESPMIMLQHWLAPRGCKFDVVAAPQSANGLLPARLPEGCQPIGADISPAIFPQALDSLLPARLSKGCQPKAEKKRQRQPNNTSILEHCTRQ